jgi:hypothetical protein
MTMKFKGDFYQIGVVVRDIDAGWALGLSGGSIPIMKGAIATGAGASPIGTPSPNGATSIWK